MFKQSSLNSLKHIIYCTVLLFLTYLKNIFEKIARFNNNCSLR